MRIPVLLLLVGLVTFPIRGQDIPSGLTARQRANYLLEHAYAFYSADLDRADSLFRATLTDAERGAWRPERAAALRYLGIVRFLLGDYPEALARYQACLSLYEELGDAGGQAAVLHEMGNFFKKRGEIDRSRKMALRSEALSRRAGDSIVLSNSLDLHGTLDLDAGDQAAASRRFDEVLLIRRAIGDSIGLAYIYENLSRLAISQGEVSRALTFLDSTVWLRRSLGDRHGEAISVNNQGEALLVAGDTLAAVPYLEESLAISTAVSFTDLQKWTMNLLAQAYAATGDFPTALSMQRSVQLLKDSLYNAATTERIAEMQERFETVQRDRELERRAAQLRQRTAWLVAALLGLLLLGATLLWVRQRAARRREALRREADVRLRDDRLRISRDLHDHLGAELGIIASELNRHDRGNGALRPYVSQLRGAIEQMRETIWAVRLEGATWTDLFSRLRQFADRLEGTACTFELDAQLADRHLDAPEVLHLYRFGQEALRNAHRHAQASRITVYARPGSFGVRDDGSGFPVGQPAGEGFGLASLEERSREVGGHFYRRAAAGGGAEVGMSWSEYAEDRMAPRDETMEIRP